MPLWYRLRQMSGFANEPHMRHLYIAGMLALIVAFVLAACALALLLSRRLPPPVEWFAYASAAAVAGIFLWPAQFHYHFSGFLAPFLGLSVALSASRLLAAIAGRPGSLAGVGPPVGDRPGSAEPGADGAAAGVPAGARRRAQAGRVLSWSAAGLAVAGLAAGTWNQAAFESKLKPVAPVAMMAAGQRIIPPGSCVLADNVAYTVTANRFVSSVPGCPTIDDGTGANYALSKGRSTATGAGRVPAVAAIWRSAFEHAQYIWLTSLNRRRIAWTPALTAYFHANFVHVANHTHDLRLYVRKGLHTR
jgi:hypothetical protein